VRKRRRRKRKERWKNWPITTLHDQFFWEVPPRQTGGYQLSLFFLHPLLRTHFSDLANFFCGREEWWRLTVSESLKEGGIPLVEKTKWKKCENNVTEGLFFDLVFTLFWPCFDLGTRSYLIRKRSLTLSSFFFLNLFSHCFHIVFTLFSPCFFQSFFSWHTSL